MLANIEKIEGRSTSCRRTGHADDSKADERKIIIRKLESARDSKLTDEKKAQIDKARARVDALRNEMLSTQKKLHEAEMDLMKMRGDLHGSLEIRPDIHTRIEPDHVRVVRADDHEVHRQIRRRSRLRSTPRLRRYI